MINVGNNLEKQEKKWEMSEIGEKILEESVNFKSEKINELNSELAETGTDFIENALEQAKEKMKPQDFKNFNKALEKHGVADLACGNPGATGFRRILTYLFKDNLESFNGDPEAKKKDVYDMEIAEPLKYIGVDKYANFNEEDTKELSQVQFIKEDLIVFLKNFPDSNINIFLGGFDYDISKTAEGNEDKYRAIMLAHIAKVLPEGGFFLAVNSVLSGKWNGQEINPENLGLKKVEFNGIGTYMYTK